MSGTVPEVKLDCFMSHLSCKLAKVEYKRNSLVELHLQLDEFGLFLALVQTSVISHTVVVVP